MSSLGFGITNFNKLQALPLNRERRTYLVRSTESVEPIACLCVRPKASNLSLSVAFDRKRRTYLVRSTERVERIAHLSLAEVERGLLRCSSGDARIASVAMLE